MTIHNPRRSRFIAWFASLAVVTACAGDPIAQSQALPPPAEIASPRATTAPAPRAPWRLEGQPMAAAADPRAVDAALAMLERGGSAVDAAIAAQAVLGLVEPQSSGIGGGAFLLHYEQASGSVSAFDGRETAPAAAGPDLFLDETGKPLPRFDAVASGRSVGAPGAIAMLALAHGKYGRLPWRTLFDPAIALAENGFVVSPRLADWLTRMQGRSPLSSHPVTAAYFYPEGKPLAVGFKRDNPAYAASLRRIAAEGPAGFYRGPIAEAIIASVQEAPRPGRLTLADLAGYRARELTPLCGPYKRFKLCSMPPPSSGGVAVLSILGTLDALALPPAPPQSAESWRRFAEASRLAYADRDLYVADDAFVSVPTADLVDPRYLKTRAALIQPSGALADVAAGDPGAVLGKGSLKDGLGADRTDEAPGTSHVSIVDARGNAVALTTTIEAPFGAQRMAAGFMLNNQLTDFSLVPEIDGKPVANAPAGGKRPRSSMAPTLVFDETGALFAVAGSPGGNSIIAYVAKTLMGVLDWDLPAQAAIDLPSVIARGPSVRVETGLPGSPTIVDGLRGAGFDVRESQSEASGLHVIIARETAWEGGADKRREGVAKPARPAVSAR